MNTFFRYLGCVILTLVTASCSVDPASVNGNPPVTPDVVFKAGVLSGTFETKSEPVAFLWPVEENGKPLTRDERIQKRADIIAELELLTLKGAEAQPFIDQLTGLTVQFLQQQCGLFSVPPDASLQQVATWKDPENDEEAAAIQACQLNMMERGKIYQENPIIGEAAQLKEKVFGVTIGLQNLLRVESLKVEFSNGASGGQPSIDLSGFNGEDFSTSSEEEAYRVKDVVLDRSFGTLQFSVPDTQAADEDKVVSYKFELEINVSEGITTMGGEIERIDEANGTSLLGRVSFSGLIDQSPAE